MFVLGGGTEVHYMVLVTICLVGTLIAMAFMWFMTARTIWTGTVMLFLAIALIAIPTIKIFTSEPAEDRILDNPYSSSLTDFERYYLTPNTEKIGEVIEDEAQLEKLTITTTRHLYDLILEGQEIDFDAHKNGESIEGEFHFTDDTLEVIIYEDNGKTEQISIPTGE